MAQITGFDASQVDQLVIDLENAWPDARANEFTLEPLQTEAMEGIMKEQTVEILDDLTANDGCKPVKVIWPESKGAATKHGQSTNHTAVPCVIDGEGIASNSAEYQIIDYLETSLKIPVKDCGNRYTTDKQFRIKFQATQIQLANDLARLIPDFLEDNAGKSVIPGLLGQYGGAGADHTLLEIPGGNYNTLDFVPYLRELQRFNKFRNPFLLDGDALYYVRANARNQDGTYAGDEGQQNALRGLRMYEDPLGFADAGLDDRSFFIDRGAVAMLTAAFGPQRANVSGNGFAETQFRVPLLGLTFNNGPDRRASVEHDTIYRLERTPIAPGSQMCEDYNVWYLRIWYKLLVNPQMSNDETGVNGILRLKRNNALTQIGTPMQKAL